MRDGNRRASETGAGATTGSSYPSDGPSSESASDGQLGSERSPEGIRLLHVEDDEAFAALTTTYLSRLAPGIDCVSASTLSEARGRLEGESFDAIVSDHDLPDGTGIEFLRDVRDDDPSRSCTDPNLPFILFTGKGSEEVASEAISAGVTDYLQKRGGADQYAVLVNRVHNAVDRHRLERQVDRSLAALETASEPIGILDEEGVYLFANAAYAGVYGLRPNDLVGTHWSRLYPSDEIDRFTDRILPRVVDDGHWTGEATGVRVDGTPVRERLALTHTSGGGHVCVIREADPAVNSDREGSGTVSEESEGSGAEGGSSEEPEKERGESEGSGTEESGT
ncbi:response regulator [Halorubrum sp. JWXQ-INN 858]|uniref:response regulator n=1 Tax=Halorubrum sp. JWXQ-INN 858 TaxID=2690782 RepID=UPI00135CA261|nr:response regulator [Halorubrum sp. JWXQ-INN 858]MWV64646.1 response regulator [Halorubrum sp. JWXQ-INN 858]